MSVLPRFVPPAGTVLRGRDVLGWLGEAAARGDARPALATIFRERYGLPHVFLVSSARAGMTVLLRVLAERAPGRREVAVPGYTCYSVAASAVRAGLRVRPLDISAETLDIAPAALDAAALSRSLALVGTNLYGIPSDAPRLEDAARTHGAAFIDDAAQCLDGRIGGRWAGTFGDAGLFSFDKGKNVTSIQGGVIACRDPGLADGIGRACAALPPQPPASVAAQGAKLLAYYVLLRPWLYWIANRMVRLGETPFELDSPMTRYPAALAPAVRRQMERIALITEARARNAARLGELLADVPGIRIPGRGGATAVFPRFPVVFDEPARRERVRDRLVLAGIGATGSYPRALRDIPELQPHLAPETADTPSARAVAAGILTLPTHGFVTDADLATISRVLRSA